MYLHDPCFYSVFSSFKGSDDMPDPPALEVLSVTEPRGGHPFVASGLKHLSIDDPKVFEYLVSMSELYGQDLFLRPMKTTVIMKTSWIVSKTVQCPCFESLWIPSHNTFSEEVEHKIIELPSVKALRLDSHKNDHPVKLGGFLRSMYIDNLKTLEI